MDFFGLLLILWKMRFENAFIRFSKVYKSSNSFSNSPDVSDYPFFFFFKRKIVLNSGKNGWLKKPKPFASN